MTEIIAKKLTELSAQKEQLLTQQGAVIGKEAFDHERSDAVGNQTLFCHVRQG